MKTILEYATGLHQDVPHAVYHQRHLGLASKSALDLVHRAPLFYKAWVDGLEADPSEALEFGGGFHCALLEPDRFASSYVVMPRFEEYRDKAGKLSTKEGKAKRDEWVAAHKDCTIIEADDQALMRSMVAAVHAHPLASRMVRDGLAEVTLRWKDADTGLQCKARADYYVRSRRKVVDVKTTYDASSDAFRRSVANYRYHVQDAIYRAAFAAIGEPIDHFVFVVVEKRPPHAVAIYTLDSDAIQRGYAHAMSDMQRLAECVRNDDFPGYPVTIQTLELPPWAA